MTVSGFFNIHKPKGITSHDVVAKVRRILGQRKVGHAGTLDPLATGVLLVCVGQATRLIEYLMAGQKQYRATIHFGKTTTTADAEGDIVEQNDASALTEASLKALLPQFTGNIQQKPPLYSAIKHKGQPLYKRVRAGETVEVKPRPVTIETLTWVAWNPPHLTVDVTCSPGTYIRSLARDLGVASGVGAYLADLVRTKSSRFTVTEAVSLEALAENYPAYLQPLDEAIVHLPRVTVTEQQVKQIQYGQLITLETTATPPLCAYTPQGRFFAILTAPDPTQPLWQPKKVFHVVNQPTTDISS